MYLMINIQRLNYQQVQFMADLDLHFQITFILAKNATSLSVLRKAKNGLQLIFVK